LTLSALHKLKGWIFITNTLNLVGIQNATSSSALPLRKSA